MSDSYSTEEQLRKLANELESDGSILREAADLLEHMRISKNRQEVIAALKKRVSEWLGYKR